MVKIHSENCFDGGSPTVFFIETHLLNCYTKTVLQIQEMGLWL